MNIIEKTDEELLAIAHPLWRDLVKGSNEGKYGEFAKNFSKPLVLAMNDVVAGRQRRRPARGAPRPRGASGAHRGGAEVGVGHSSQISPEVREELFLVRLARHIPRVMVGCLVDAKECFRLHRVLRGLPRWCCSGGA